MGWRTLRRVGGHSSIDAAVGRVVVKIGRVQWWMKLVLLPLLLVLLLALALEVELMLLLLLLLARSGEIGHGMLPVLTVVSPAAAALAESSVHEGRREERARGTKKKQKWEEVSLAALTAFSGDVFLERGKRFYTKCKRRMREGKGREGMCVQWVVAMGLRRGGKGWFGTGWWFEAKCNGVHCCTAPSFLFAPSLPEHNKPG